MRTSTTTSGNLWLALMQCLVIPLFAISPVYAGISITVSGQANGASVVQGAPFSWNISGLTNGAVVSNELWLDLNSNGEIDAGTDYLFVVFPQQDGLTGGDQGPGDDDATANGTITSTIAGMYFPVSYYVFKVKSGTDSATSSYQETAMSGATYSVNGRVTQGGVGKANVAVAVETQNNGSFYALTNATGYYTISTNLSAGTGINVRIQIDAFNSQLAGMIASPDGIQFNLTGHLYNVNFTLRTGKIVTGIVTDMQLNPIADMEVNIYQTGGGYGYNGRTDGNGRYYIAVDTGTYTVQFGSNQDPKGYIKMYYNQKNVGWLSDQLYISLSADTIRNIDAQLAKGGIITGTFMKDGVPVRGNITVFAYNNSSTPLYETWHDQDNPYYFLVVPPGTYSVQFNLENGQSQCYFDQTWFSPGTPVIVQAVGDTTFGINVNFSTLPKVYTFNGWGNWNNPGNWQNNQLPPSTLPKGDYIIINGGQCTLSGTQTIAIGAYLVVRNGATLQVNGNLIRQ